MFSLTYREENPICIYKRHFISFYYNRINVIEYFTTVIKVLSIVSIIPV